MTAAAVALVLAAAVIHATWNLLTKRTGGGGGAFVWLAGSISALVYAPVAAAAVVLQHPHFGLIEITFIAGTAFLHLGYFIALLRGYRAGDLSLVYPLARGTGPALATIAAIAFFGERPTAVALAGAGLVIAGILAMTGGANIFHFRRATETVRRAIGYALLTGVTIAVYTLWDKHAVSVLLIPPLILEWFGNAGRVAFLTPFALRRWSDVRHHWAHHRLETIGVAILSPLSYILVLTALVFTPVSYVAPAREVSILIGAGMGTRFLAEGDARRRMIAATALVAGVVALALG
jgi:drug/metabolite transporter (DMT)-like permease